MTAMSNLHMGKQLTPTERDTLSKYMFNMTDIMLKDDTVFNRTKLHTQKTKYQTEESTVELDEKMVDGVEVVDGPEEDMKKMKMKKKEKDMKEDMDPEEEERMRRKAENKARRLSVKSRSKFRMLPKEIRKEKEKAGLDEEVTSFNENYKAMFEATLEFYGVDNIRDLPEEKKKDFFAIIDEAMKMDPVGQEDADVDNDGDSDSSDSYLKKRRKAIAKAMKKEEVEQIDEYGNPAATPDRLAMIRRAADRVQSGQAGKDAMKRAKADMKQKGAQRGMAPTKKDVQEQIIAIRKTIKEGSTKEKIEAYKELNTIIEQFKTTGEL